MTELKSIFSPELKIIQQKKNESSKDELSRLHNEKLEKIKQKSFFVNFEKMKSMI
jgi:hypothetical protein